MNGKVFEINSRPTQRAPDAGDSAYIPSIFHALAFFQLDGFAVPAPAQVTQTVGRLSMKLQNEYHELDFVTVFLLLFLTYSNC